MGIETALIGIGTALGVGGGGTAAAVAGGAAVAGAVGAGVGIGTAVAKNNKKRDNYAGIGAIQDPGKRQRALDNQSSEKARKILASGGNPGRLVKSQGLTGSTSSGSSARRRLMGG
jgi:hypothetical protein